MEEKRVALNMQMLEPFLSAEHDMRLFRTVRTVSCVRADYLPALERRHVSSVRSGEGSTPFDPSNLSLPKNGLVTTLQALPAHPESSKCWMPCSLNNATVRHDSPERTPYGHRTELADYALVLNGLSY